MIQTISMDMDDMNEILEALPPNLKDKIINKIKPDSGISIIKQFAEQYEEDSTMDYIVAQVMSNLIRTIAATAKELAAINKLEGKNGFSTIELIVIIIKCIKNEAKNMQNALNYHEKECTKGDDCGAKH